MVAIERVCKKTILLSNGKIKLAGDTIEVIKKYLEKVGSPTISEPITDKTNPVTFIKGAMQKRDSKINLEFEFETTVEIENPNIVAILWKGNIRVCNIVSGNSLPHLKQGEYKVKFSIHNLTLSYGHYHVSVRLRNYFNPLCTYGINGHITEFFVSDVSDNTHGINIGESGVIDVNSSISIKSIGNIK